MRIPEHGITAKLFGEQPEGITGSIWLLTRLVSCSRLQKKLQLLKRVSLICNHMTRYSMNMNPVPRQKT